MAEQDCIFCQVVAGKISADIIYTDSLDDASGRDEGVLGHLLRVAARVANSEGLSDSGYRTVINTGAGAGQSVFHLHLHIIGGRPLSWPPG
jgi:histidine triad (HIT) family protein